MNLSNIRSALNSSSHVQFIAKAFLVGYGAQAVLAIGPMLSDPASIIISITHLDFDYTFINGALGKALVAAWGILLSSPYDNSSSPSTLTQLPIKTDLINK